MNYFEHLAPLVPGTTVRAAPLNTIFDAIQASFELLPPDHDGEFGFESTVWILAGTDPNHAVNRFQLQNWPTFSPSPVVDLGANRFTNALNPVDAQDLTTKAWVESTYAGILAQAQASADAAAVSETNAATSETNAASSETVALNSANSAATSESNAAASATSASNSASTASTAQTNASNSASAAATSEGNAATSETNASNSASAASTSETNAANSASAASTSETNAAASATSAGNSATTATNAASNAGTSETNAAASETKANEWAVHPEDTFVPGTSEYSAYHWAQKAQDASIGTINISDVTNLQTELDGKVDDAQVLTNVPVGAVFTDTVYSHPTSSGNKHIPAGGSSNQILRWLSDGTAQWSNEASAYVHPSYTARNESQDTGPLTGATVISDLDFNISVDTSGHVTAVDFTTLATRELTLADLGYTGATNANNYSHPTSAGNKHIPAGGSSGQILKWSSSGTAIWANETDTVYTHPSHPGDDISVDTGALTGAAVISDLDFHVNTDGEGHVTGAAATVATRNLTLANLGYTGAVNANNYVHPTSAGNKHIPSGGAANQFLKYSSSGTAIWSSIGLSDVGFTGDSDANNYVHPTFAGDDFSIDTGPLSGGVVISDLDINVTTDSQGHVTDCNAAVATRILTAAQIGAAAAQHTHTNVTLVDDSGDTVCYPIFANSATGSKALKTGSNLTFNAVTGKLTATILSSSDARMKDIVGDFERADLDAIKAKEFYWKDKKRPQEIQLGYIAQEVESVMPQAVEKGKGGLLAVDYTMVHTAKIAELEAKVERLTELLGKVAAND